MMKNSLTSYIDLLTPWLSTDLVSEPYLNCIRRIGDELPLLSFGCIECWLASNEPRVDFNVGIKGNMKEYNQVNQWFTNLSASPDELQKVSLKKLRTICNIWGDSRLFLQSQINVLWLVYDLLDPLRLMPVPWMYIQFRENSFIRDAEVRTELIMQTLALMSNEYSQERLQLFSAFFDSLSPVVQVRAIGTLGSRGSHLLRVYLAVQHYTDVLRILTDHQWIGNVDELAQEMTQLTPYCDFFALLIDIDPHVQPKIGVECWFYENHAQEKLTIFTDYLLERGLCDARKRNALLNWNGTSETYTGAVVKSDRCYSTVAGGEKRTVIRRMAHYIKLTYEPEKPLIAKSYLYFDR